MRETKHLLQGAMLIVAATAAPAWAQAKIDTKLMQVYGGVLAAAAATGATAAAGSGNSAKMFKGYALTELSAAGLLYNARAKEIYHKALGPLVKEPWLARLDGPSSEGQAMKVANDEYVMLYTCKNHDCHDHNVVLLWSGIQDVVYGKVNQKGKSTLIGNPPPAVAAELEKIWKKQFRSQAK